MPEAYWSSMKEELEQQQREIDQKKKQEEYEFCAEELRKLGSSVKCIDRKKIFIL